MRIGCAPAVPWRAGRMIGGPGMEPTVVIAGGGPTGLMLAAELALAGTAAVIVERRPDQHVDGSRAGGLHARSLEVLEQRGVADRFIAEGVTHPFLLYAMQQLDMSDMPSRHNHILGLWQRRIEPILADWVAELGVPFRRSCEVTGFVQDETGVDVTLSDGDVLRAAYLVGCDGGRSTVRKAAGIEFAGLAPTRSWMIAETRLAEAPPVGLRPEGGGVGPADPADPDGPYRVVLVEERCDHVDEPTLEDLRAILVRCYGTDFGVHDPTWISRFTDAARQAVDYRSGRVLLAGDAAHIHPPQGGQGLNTGLLDAVNLGWKLALVAAGLAPDDLLDTYHRERHPVAARVLDDTMAQVALGTPGDRHQALRTLMGEILAMDEPRRRIVAMISGLDITYDLGEGHPLLGRRMPDLDLVTADGPTRVSTLLHAARGVVLDLTGGAPIDLEGWSDRVVSIAATTEGPWELPLVGPVESPAAVLIRPDGHVAWTGEPDDPALFDAVAAWFGGQSPAA